MTNSHWLGLAKWKGWRPPLILFALAEGRPIWQDPLQFYSVVLLLALMTAYTAEWLNESTNTPLTRAVLFCVAIDILILVALGFTHLPAAVGNFLRWLAVILTVEILTALAAINADWEIQWWQLVLADIVVLILLWILFR
jgi:hypothetical protein